ncbi:SseB family protein [Actinophytocola gossypii]|uniref:SseB family protein n=1 Tax=Actinophytocola gossypii TaxID=2812003 RepID=A0ABT2JDL3_9PSEU|nr:SseB family protein [Actinophytocola gossypii]MCT2585968.1 SseB family protein [Actinophytocola gossypii]
MPEQAAPNARRHATEYRPTPERRTELERALRLVRAGFREEATLPDAVLRAELLVYAATPDDDTVTAFPNPDGELMVPACTAEERVPAAWPGWRRVSGWDLVPQLNGHPLLVDPEGPVTATFPAELLRARLSAAIG